jgi:hypothetical protein
MDKFTMDKLSESCSAAFMAGVKTWEDDLMKMKEFASTFFEEDIEITVDFEYNLHNGDASVLRVIHKDEDIYDLLGDEKLDRMLDRAISVAGLPK